MAGVDGWKEGRMEHVEVERENGRGGMKINRRRRGKRGEVMKADLWLLAKKGKEGWRIMGKVEEGYTSTKQAPANRLNVDFWLI